jgi:hypothetical protein
MHWHAETELCTYNIFACIEFFFVNGPTGLSSASVAILRRIQFICDDHLLFQAKMRVL